MKLKMLSEDVMNNAVDEVNRRRKDSYISSHRSVGEIITMVAREYQVNRSALARALNSRRQRKQAKPEPQPEPEPTATTLFDIHKTKIPVYNH